jgi:hypothetical protein
MGALRREEQLQREAEERAKHVGESVGSAPVTASPGVMVMVVCVR